MKQFIFLMLISATLCAAPQAIVFDFCGVMTATSNQEVVVDFMCESFQLTRAEFRKVNLKRRKAGKTDEEFWIAFADKRGVILPANWLKEYKTVMIEAIGVNREMYSLVDQLKEENIPIALLSNIDDRHAKLIREVGLYEPFNPCLLSCEMGIRKPDPKAYKILLDQFDLPSADIVFIDDKPENIKAAKKLGIDAILFESTDQIRQELNQRGLLLKK